MRRPDVDAMDDAIDKVWLYLFVGYVAFGCCAIISAGLFNSMLGLWGLVAMIPWAVQAVRAQMLINNVNRRTRELRR
jgi:hypothetical protein